MLREFLDNAFFIYSYDPGISLANIAEVRYYSKEILYYYFMHKRDFDRIRWDISVKFYQDLLLCTGTVTNLSEKGMCIESRNFFYPCCYDIEVHIPMESKVFGVEAKIRWIKKSDSVTYRLGIELCSTPDYYLEFIDDLMGMGKCSNGHIGVLL